MLEFLSLTGWIYCSLQFIFKFFDCLKQNRVINTRKREYHSVPAGFYEERMAALDRWGVAIDDNGPNMHAMRNWLIVMIACLLVFEITAV